jgi:hypothetical protein
MSQFTHLFNKEPVIGHMPAYIRASNGTVERTSGRMTDDSGEINASSIKELKQRVTTLTAMARNGQIDCMGQVKDSEWAKSAQEDAALLKAAYASGDEHNIKLTAEVMLENVWESANRMGWTDHILGVKDCPDGVPNQIEIYRHDAVAFQTLADGAATEQLVHPAFVYPPDYTIQCQIVMNEADIARAGPDFVDRKMQDGLMALMVKRDRILRNLMLQTAGIFNAPTTYATFTPQVLATMKNQVDSNLIPSANLLIASDLWVDITSAGAWMDDWTDPVHKYQILQEGKLGTILGLNVITDGFRPQLLQVLQPGEAFVTGAPQFAGIHGYRRRTKVTEIQKYIVGQNSRGFYFASIENSYVNAFAFAYGVRA